MYKRLFQILLAFYLTPFFCFSQENENQLALLYYSQGEYEKAADIYLTLVKKTHSQTHFDYLISCYKELQQYDNAEKITKEQINYYSNSFYYTIKLATIYIASNKNKEANDIFEKTIKKANKNLENCLTAGAACLENKVDSVAKIIYENGQKQYPENRMIAYALGQIYLNQREYSKLADLYLDLIKSKPNEEDFVEKQLQFPLYEQKNTALRDTLMTHLVKAIEKERKLYEYQKLYLWMLIQVNDFETAFTIAQHLDDVLDLDGANTLSLGDIALETKDYAMATKCFSTVVQIGPMGSNYEIALEELLETSYNKLFASGQIPEIQEIETLEKEYQSALNTFGDSKSSVDIIKNLAHIQAFFLAKQSDAIQLLKQSIQSANLRQYKSTFEMELADIYLYTNEIWDANLQYAAIALNNKNKDIGHEAQLKQAKIAYFNGNFDYAKALLDVLKGSTSKLIANDAFELAQLISDNTALDTSTTALEIFARGDLLIFQNKRNDALLCYDSITQSFPGHTLEDEILMRKAEIAKCEQNNVKMLSYLQEIEERFAYEIYADKAIYTLAEYYEKHHDFNKAQEKYKKLIVNYPNSIYAATARKRYRELESTSLKQ